jgi:hypothetical protein
VKEQNETIFVRHEGEAGRTKGEAKGEHLVNDKGEKNKGVCMCDWGKGKGEMREVIIV